MPNPTAARLPSLAEVRAERARRRHALDPVAWATERLGVHFWSKQQQIAEAVAGSRHVAVRSAHGTGKSYLAGALAAWWIDTRPVGEAFAVTSAPTTAQVEAILWREINRHHKAGGLPGTLTWGGVPQWKIGDELVAYGRKPADAVDKAQASAAFQGIHAKYVLVILDEACGIPQWLWTATESLVTNEHSKVLAIGNPDDPQTPFAGACEPGSGWDVIGISAFDTPAFTGEPVPDGLLDLLPSRRWVEERKRGWGEASPLYTSKVRGEFPEVDDSSLISPAWVRLAREIDLDPGDDEHSRIGCDIARSGSDETVLIENCHGRCRIPLRADGQPAAWHGFDLMRTAGEIHAIIRPHLGQKVAAIDVVGLGAGVYDRLREQQLSVARFDAGAAPLPDGRSERFANRRAQVFWQLRDELRRGRLDLDPDDDDLASQLLSLRYYVDSRGRICLESKDDMRARGLPSPDRADALAMSLAPPVQPEETVLATDTPGLTDDLMTREW